MFSGVQGRSVTKRAAEPSKPRQITIDLDKAVAVAMPAFAGDLKPASFTTKDGKKGWALRIPGGRPIATPAYADGKIFVGGGFGSHEFYAFDAATGEVVWQIKTSDDGPTAAVVEDGCVAFNTESCTVIVTDAKTGKILWEEWLGDPLMSQPAIHKGKLYIAYPAGQKGHADNKNKEYHFKLLCADLRTGKHFWETEIPADVISAPVIEGDAVYFTCMDGTSFCLDANTGTVRWTKKNSGTSAPLIVDGQVVVTEKQKEKGKTYEGMRRLDLGGKAKDSTLIARGTADHLGEGKGGNTALGKSLQYSLNDSVGFSAAPPAAKLDKANKQLGVDGVVGGWAYQGSRAAHSNGLFFNAQGSNLNSVTKSGKGAWIVQTRGKGISADQQLFSPPSLGVKNMYLSSAKGHLMAVKQADGSLQFAYDFKQPIVFQPTLAAGSMYAGTANGIVICLQTGDKDADGWHMWGGNAQHNKASAKK